jgi:uncharacterized protein (DUF488 family)
MHVFTIGYVKKDAQAFFELLKANRIDVLIDVRLYNSSQLAGFSKSRDLKYFLEQICDCGYIWAKHFAPTPELLDGYKSGFIKWSEYEKIYNDLLNTRNNMDFFEDFAGKRICLLCAEATPERCHRRLLAEKIASVCENIQVTHL